MLGHRWFALPRTRQFSLRAEARHGGGPVVLSRFPRRVLAGLWVAGLISVGGCVSLQTTGAGNVQDLQAEGRYKAIYAEQMTKIGVDNQLFAPASSKPGVCNVGGSQQGCFEADAQLILDFQGMLKALEATPVPPRYSNADKLLREAIAEDIRGLGLRNQAIAQHDDAAWTEHKIVLQNALAGLQQAYQAFPGDNRPEPAP